MRATATIPIVVSGGTDPVKLGLVASLSQPGGNMTSLFLPRSRRSGWGCCMRWLPKPRPWPCLSTRTIRELKARCETCRRRRSASGELVVLRANTNSDFGDAFATLVQQHAGALLVCTSPFFNSRREQLIMLAARHAVPAMYEFREFASAGGLISYGTSLADAYRQVGVDTGRIFKGAKHADLPVVQSTRFEFVINLRTAKALGLEVPLTLAAGADEVIE